MLPSVFGGGFGASHWSFSIGNPAIAARTTSIRWCGSTVGLPSAPGGSSKRWQPWQ